MPRHSGQDNARGLKNKKKTKFLIGLEFDVILKFGSLIRTRRELEECTKIDGNFQIEFGYLNYDDFLVNVDLSIWFYKFDGFAVQFCFL